MGNWKNRTKLVEGMIWLSLLLPIALYGRSVWLRSPRIPLPPEPIFQGILYKRIIETQPRPKVIHLFEIDLSEPTIQPFVTPSIENAPFIDENGQPRVTVAQRTASFLQRHNLQLAVNANFFYPFEEIAPWHYKPHEGDLSSVIGISISEGKQVSSMHPRYSSLCFLSQRAEIVWQQECPEDTQQAVSGHPLWLGDSPPPDDMMFVADKLKSAKAYPLTLAALNAEGTRLWLLVSDGKQPLYSEGTTIKEAVDRLKTLGATTAVQLDGGGSTTAVIASDNGPQVLNAVIHAKIPGNERPVANNLGFYAQPVQP